MQKGNNQTIVRDFNMKLIIEALKREKLSSSDLANKLHLSKPALSKIMDGMVELSLVFASENKTAKTNTKGRKKTYFQLNGESGLVGVIYFVGTYIKILLADMTGTVVEEKVLKDCEFITHDILDEVVRILKIMIQSHESDSKNLLNICISAPGKINKYTSEIEQSPKFLMANDFRLAHFLKDIFNVRVSVKNDINMLMVGEKNNGSFKDKIKNALLLHIDVGIGGAILNENQILEGEQGYAGEFGLIKTFDRFGNSVYYDTLCSTNAILNQIKYYRSIGEVTSLGESFVLDDVVNAFHQGDPLTRHVVLDSARYIGILVGNLFNIYNYYNILISGGITMFGDDYLDVVKHNSNSDVKQYNISFAQLGAEATTLGVIYTALDEGFNYLLELRKLKY
jgi:predicted NBD/HSP70 family sugar kinase